MLPRIPLFERVGPVIRDAANLVSFPATKRLFRMCRQSIDAAEQFIQSDKGCGEMIMNYSVRRLHIYSAVWVFLVVAVGGCRERSRMFVENSAVSGRLRIVDAETGEGIKDALLTIKWRETPEFVLRRIPHSHQIPRSHTLRVELRQVSNHDSIRQEEIARREVMTKEGIRTRFVSIDYDVAKDGYISKGFTHDMVVGYAEMGNPITIKLRRETPGKSYSDISALNEAKFLEKDTLPFLEDNDPLRGRLLELVLRQLERVVKAGENAEEAQQAIKKLQSYKLTSLSLPKTSSGRE